MTDEQKLIVRFVEATDYLAPDNVDLLEARRLATALIPQLAGNPNIADLYRLARGRETMAS